MFHTSGPVIEGGDILRKPLILYNNHEMYCSILLRVGDRFKRRFVCAFHSDKKKTVGDTGKTICTLSQSLTLCLQSICYVRVASSAAQMVRLNRAIM